MNQQYVDSYLFTERSSNQKTGPMPVITSSKRTCPDACPLKAGACYAKHGPLGHIWESMSKTEPGNAFKNGRSFVTTLSFSDLLDKIRTVASGQIYRFNQAGDLPGDGQRIDRNRLWQLVLANRGKLGFTYTHYPPTAHNLDAIRKANENGFTINLSADSLDEADTLAEARAGPVVTVLPSDQLENLATPGGRTVVVCPAYTKSINCDQCRLCQKQRSTIVGFPAHGAAYRRAESVYNSQPLEVMQNEQASLSRAT